MFMAPPGPPIGTKGVGSTVPVADVYNRKNIWLWTMQSLYIQRMEQSVQTSERKT